MERKVVAYIEHRSRPGVLAAFVHADDDTPLFDSGLQVPAGSIEPQESEVEAVLREAVEESGLEGLQVERRLGSDMIQWPGRRQQHRTFFHLTADGPDRWRHVARHEGAPSRIFDFQWIPFESAPLLAGGQGLFVHLLLAAP